MSDKLEYSDYHKFLTSVGILFIITAFTWPLLFSISGDGLLITHKDYFELMCDSRELLNTRIELNTWVFNHTLLISAILILIGVLILVYSLPKWQRKQKVMDDEKEVDYKRGLHEYNEMTKKAGVVSMSNEDLDDRYKTKQSSVKQTDSPSDIEEEAETAESTEELKKEDKNKHTSDDFKNDEVALEYLRNSIRTKVISIQNMFYLKMLERNSFNYRIEFSKKIANEFPVDVILFSLNQQKFPDKFIEIVCFENNKIDINKVKQSFGRAMRARNSYFSSTSRAIEIIVIVVYEREHASRQVIDEFKSSIYDFIEQSRVDFSSRIIVLEYHEAMKYDINNIIS